MSIGNSIMLYASAIVKVYWNDTMRNIIKLWAVKTTLWEGSVVFSSNVVDYKEWSMK